MDLQLLYYYSLESPPVRKETTVCFLTSIQCYSFCCPHCNTDVTVEKDKLNCKIFRCGTMKKDGQQIGPHTSKEECDRLFREQLIYGCGKPFKFDGYIVEVCEYI